MASLISRVVLLLSLATLTLAQLSVPVPLAMQRWEQEVKYYGPEQNAFHILKVLSAFAQYYTDNGVEPPRALFNGPHYHDAWDRLRMVRFAGKLPRRSPMPP